MKKGFLYLLLASCLLCSCDNKKLDNYDITPIKEQDLVVNDVYEAVNKLHTLKNYTINIKIESDTENTEYYNIYAEKYFFNGYEGLEEEGIIDKWFSKKSVQIGVQKLEEEKKNIKGDNKYKEQFIADFNDKILIANALIDQFDFGIIRRLSIMNTHGDYSIQQLIYNEGKLATVIDFETAKKMPIVWEIVRSYSYVDKNAEDGKIDTDNLIQYFKEVSKYVELNEYDLKFAPHIYLMQLIGSTFGYREYNKDCSQKDLLKFALFRTNLCRSLYANLDKISESLLENVPHRQMILEER